MVNWGLVYVDKEGEYGLGSVDLRKVLSLESGFYTGKLFYTLFITDVTNFSIKVRQWKSKTFYLLYTL